MDDAAVHSAAAAAGLRQCVSDDDDDDVPSHTPVTNININIKNKSFRDDPL